MNAETLDPIALPPEGFRDKESLIAHGMKLREDLDRTQWALGDLILFVWSKNIMLVSEFAKNIGLGRSTAFRYQKISFLFPQSLRGTYQARGVLCYTHFRHVSEAFFDDNRVMLQWLDKAETNLWTVDELKARIIEYKNGEPLEKQPRVVFDEIVTRSEAIRWLQMQRGEYYRVTVREVKEAREVVQS